MVGRVKNWAVMEEYTGSDHQYISYTIAADDHRNSHTMNRNSMKKWNISKLNMTILTTEINRWHSHTNKDLEANLIVGKVMRIIEKACNASMPTISSRNSRRPRAYWWNDEIAKLRQDCLQCRRKLTRAHKRNSGQEENEAYREARKKLKKAIEHSKKQKWKQLCNDVNVDPWGLGYKIVMKKLGNKGPVQDMNEETIKNIVDTLFPQHARRKDEALYIDPEEIPLFMEKELYRATMTLKNKKAPGPDKLPAEIIKLVAQFKPNMLLDMYNTCLKQGVFPKTWKRQRLVLLSKGKGDPISASHYRPLCMLDAAGKVLERLLKPRLISAIQAAGDLSARQYGFRKGKSIIGAVEEVVKAASVTRCGNHFSRPIVLLVTLDVKNAFNSVRWIDILDTLESRFQAPKYLIRMIQSYLKDRVLLYETKDGVRTKEITSGAAQGSILGPLLWNISYDDIFRIEQPDDTFLVGYADDIAAVITARNKDQAQCKLTQMMIRTKHWLEAHGPTLAMQETELLFITRKQIPSEIEIRLNNSMIMSQKVRS